MEKRRHRRYPRRFKVRFGDKGFTQQGFTSDVSETGMFVVTSPVPKLGTRVHVEVTMELERTVYFEGIVARMALVAPELRSVMKGGFGMRFLAPGDLVAEMVPHLRDAKNRLELSYPTVEAFTEAYEKELKRGGAFVWSDREHAVNSIVTLEVDASFAKKRLGFEARVLHVVPDATGRFGLALMFIDVNAALTSLQSVLKP